LINQQNSLGNCLSTCLILFHWWVNYDKKFSDRWRTTQRLCTSMLRSAWHKTLWSTDFHAVLSRAALWWMTAIYWPDFPSFIYPSLIWRRQSPRAIGFIFCYWKTRTAGLQSSEGRMMIDSVVWAQHINVTDSHVDIANAIPMHWHWVAKMMFINAVNQKKLWNFVQPTTTAAYYYYCLLLLLSTTTTTTTTLLLCCRFKYEGIWRDKITAHVDFPVEGLNMTRYISGPHKREPYNLFAVSVCSYSTPLLLLRPHRMCHERQTIATDVSMAWCLSVMCMCRAKLAG